MQCDALLWVAICANGGCMDQAAGRTVPGALSPPSPQRTGLTALAAAALLHRWSPPLATALCVCPLSPSVSSTVTAADSGSDVLLMMRAISETIGELIKWAQSPAAARGAEVDVRRIKNACAARVGANRSPKLVDILAALPDEWRKKLAPLLTAKPIRSASGISVVAVMCKPHRCPHIAMTGNICVYCIADDHEILTNRGFRGLAEFEAEAERAPDSVEEPLLVAAYDHDEKQLVFQEYKLVVRDKEPRQQTLISFEDDNEAQRWGPNSDIVAAAALADPESGPAAAAASARVSLLVTPDHRMFVQAGRISTGETGEESAAWDGDQVSQGPGQPTKWVERDYRKVLASELLSSDAELATRMLGYAPEGPAKSQFVEVQLRNARHIKEVPFHGRTWCVSVPTGKIVVRRAFKHDGKVVKASLPIIMGNCPGGPDSDFEYSTQAYTGYEPTSMRAIRARYDPYKQTRSRVEQLERLGHQVDKVEFIVMGGTFMSLPSSYRDYFIRNLHDALSGHTSSSLEESIAYSEQSRTKCIGLTIETRPDYFLKPHISQMLYYGCTRVEVGVQSCYEDVARDTNRGHTVRAVCESFKLAKDSGFKIIAHMMPDLPNMGQERDLEQFKEFFSNPDFRADGLKIYPTLVIRGTGLYELWKTGRYKNYSPNELIDLLAKVLALCPPWTRVYRIQRDIPMPLVSSGVEHGNLRQLVLARMKELHLPCRDVRTREVGITQVNAPGQRRLDMSQVELVRRDYTANGGWETFLAYEDPKQDLLIGLLRLRQCSADATFRPELAGQQASIVRELHVYGSAVPVHSRDPTKFQHQGYGTLLMEEAERIAREEHGSAKLAVISGVGTRHYYRKLGFTLEGPYMVKQLQPYF